MMIASKQVKKLFSTRENSRAIDREKRINNEIKENLLK